MSRYATSHINPQGAGDARPTALQIIHDEALEGNLIGKVIVVTGASSGIGIETARALSATGATLILPVRNLKTAVMALAGILEPGRVSLVEMDVSSFVSVRAGAESILKMSNNQVNILINNAGYLGTSDLKLSADGHELHFATHQLGPFLLFQLLKPALLSSATPDLGSRVVNVSSSGSRAYPLHESDNYDFQKGGYDFNAAYGHSKLAQIYMTNELDRRYGPSGLHATSLHPGGIFTNIHRNLGPEFAKEIMNGPFATQLKSSEQGAATTVIAAVGKEWEDKGGKYLEDCAEAQRGEDDGSIFSTGFVSHTYDPEKEKRLWKDSLELVGLKDDM